MIMFKANCPNCKSEMVFPTMDQWQEAVHNKSLCPACIQEGVEIKYSYTDALLSPEFIVMGTVLRPLCLGHIIILEKLKFPVFDDRPVQRLPAVARKSKLSMYLSAIRMWWKAWRNDEPGVNDLLSKNVTIESINNELRQFATAVIICGLSYEDGLKVIRDGDLFNTIVADFEKNISKIMKADSHWNYFKERNKFKQYINYYMEFPDYVETQSNKGLPSGSDWKTGLITLFKKMAYSFSEIINMSFKKLLYEWTSEAEANGGIRVTSATKNSSQVIVSDMTLEELIKAQGKVF